MKAFTDKFGKSWNVEFRFRDMERIRSRLKDEAGKPLNLLDLADRGELYRVLTSAQRMIDMVFLCCLDEVKTSFDEEAFDREHAVDAEMIPELKTDIIRKMGYWFGERLNGSALEEMTEAFKEAIVDFTRNPHHRAALRTVLENQDRLMESQALRIQKESNHVLAMTEQAMDSRLAKELETLKPDTVLQALDSGEDLSLSNHGPNV